MILQYDMVIYKTSIIIHWLVFEPTTLQPRSDFVLYKGLYKHNIFAHNIEIKRYKYIDIFEA